MKTTVEIVGAVRGLYGSDRKAAPIFGVTQATFSDWHNGDAFPTDDYAIKMAELLKVDPAYVLAIIRADRAKSKKARSTWLRVADQFKDAAVVAALAVGAVAAGGFNNNAFAGSSGTPAGAAPTQYTLQRKRTWMAAAA